MFLDLGYFFIARMERQLIKLLRHDAERVGLPMYVDGYFFLAEIRMLPGFEGLTRDKILAIAAADSKGRFDVELVNAGVFVRASQGHSIRSGLRYKKITEPVVMIHGTSWGAWESIRADGLSRRGLEYLQCCGAPGSRSGWRSNASVLVYLDTGLLLRDGVSLFRSSNDVLLTAGGVDGIICPCYFEAATSVIGEPLQFKCSRH